MACSWGFKNLPFYSWYDIRRYRLTEDLYFVYIGQNRMNGGWLYSHNMQLRLGKKRWQTLDGNQRVIKSENGQ
jgi:hypothetical protein